MLAAIQDNLLELFGLVPLTRDVVKVANLVEYLAWIARGNCGLGRGLARSPPVVFYTRL